MSFISHFSPFVFAAALCFFNDGMMSSSDCHTDLRLLVRIFFATALVWVIPDRVSLPYSIVKIVAFLFMLYQFHSHDSVLPAAITLGGFIACLFRDIMKWWGLLATALIPGVIGPLLSAYTWSLPVHQLKNSPWFSALAPIAHDSPAGLMLLIIVATPLLARYANAPDARPASERHFPWFLAATFATALLCPVKDDAYSTSTLEAELRALAAVMLAVNRQAVPAVDMYYATLLLGTFACATIVLTNPS
jgi:hypothetical protein